MHASAVPALSTRAPVVLSVGSRWSVPPGRADRREPGAQRVLNGYRTAGGDLDAEPVVPKGAFQVRAVMSNSDLDTDVQQLVGNDQLGLQPPELVEGVVLVRGATRRSGTRAVWMPALPRCRRAGRAGRAVNASRLVENSDGIQGCPNRWPGPTQSVEIVTDQGSHASPVVENAMTWLPTARVAPLEARQGEFGTQFCYCYCWVIASTIAYSRTVRALVSNDCQRLGAVAQREDVVRHARCVRCIRRVRPILPPPSAFTGFRFPREVIVLAVRWYLRYGLSYRDVEELLAERGVQVDHVTIYRWVQRFTPLLIDAARPCRHIPGDRWFTDETYVKVAGRWVYLYRAIDQYGQVIDVLVSEKRDSAATRRFFTRALDHGTYPSEVTTDRAPAYPRVLDELMPSACHITEQYANNLVEADHGRLKARLRPMRGLKQLCSTRVISAGHAFIQNLRRGHYQLGVDENPQHRLPAAFAELALAI